MKEVTSEILKTLIIPVYKNEANIPALMDAVEAMAMHYGNSFEVIFVVDGSPDNSYDIIHRLLLKKNFCSQLIALSRNFGSFSAIREGMVQARGEYIAVMAADLQEPIELIYQLFDALDSGSADVAFGQRTERKDSILQSTLSNAFWFLYRKLVFQEIPKGGVDIFACNQKVKKAVLRIEEPNSSLVAQLFWVGYRRLFIPYGRKPREHGKSSWSISKRFKYMLDSIFSFSDYPILIMLWVGILGLFSSLLFIVTTIVAKFTGFIGVPGYATVVVSVTFFGSLILTTQGIIGCYLWRTFENTKKRPLTIVDSIKLFD